MKNLQILVVEDEPLAAERLELLLAQYDKNAQIVGKLESIEETIEWLQTKTTPDIILLDIHLSDGQSFEIFKQITVQVPIIFTTAYDQYAIQAFKLNSIDYLLKPISLNDLATSLNKYRTLQQYFTPDWQMLAQNIQQVETAKAYKTRFLVKLGGKMILKEVQDVAYFFAEDKVVYLVTHDSKKYIIDFTLEHLEEILPPSHFFRISRKFIVSLPAIEEIRPSSSNRLKLMVKPHTPENTNVSRERVQDFKSWVEGV